MIRVSAALSILALAVAACAPGAPATSEASAMATPSPQSTGLTLTSPAFADGDPIPRQYTCRGDDVSPALAWSDVPGGTAALVLFVDDPDGRDWVHWTVLDLPGTNGDLSRGVAPTADPPQQGRNDFRRVGYGGPCPPSGNHHYRFTLYALAAPLGLPGNPDGATVRKALARATILARTTLVGTVRA